MRNITMVFILTCLLFLTGCTTEVEPDERVLYIEEKITETAEEITETAEDTEPFKIERIIYDYDWKEGYGTGCYDIIFVPEDGRRLPDYHTCIRILPEDYEILKNKKTTTLTLDEIKTFKNNYNSYVKKLDEEKNKEANRERTPEEIYGSY